MWSVYLVRNANNALYAGIATDVERRYWEHLTADGKGAKFTRGGEGLVLEYRCVVGSRSTALKVEYRIKRLRKQKKEEIIAQSYDRDDLLRLLHVEPGGEGDESRTID